MKTLLHVIDTTGPGGAETVFIELADRLRRRGYRSLVLVRGPGWVKSTLEQRGLEPIELDAKGSFNLGFLRALGGLIRREQVDLIQSHLLGSNVYCALAGALTRRPVVGTFHGMVDISPNERRRGLKLWVMERGIRRFVAVSDGLARAVAAEGLLNPKKTSVIYNGIDTARYQRPRHRELVARLGLPQDALLVGSLGNVRPAKGYDQLIRSAALLAERYPRLHFVIAGHIKQSVMQPLQALMGELRVADRVHFLGFCDDSADFLAGVDLFLLSSTSEGFSISTIEAMASGLPVLVTRCGGPEEIVRDGETGLMVPPADPANLAEGLAQLLDDPALATRLAAAGRADALARFDIEAMVDQYEAVYRAVGV